MDWKEIGTTTSSSSNTNGERMVWKKLWALQLPPKVKVFVWKLAHNGLATQSNKVARRMTEQSTCLIYGGGRGWTSCSPYVPACKNPAFSNEEVLEAPIGG